jgi:hypothetical protein
VLSKFLTKPSGNRLLGRPRRRWEDNISMDLRDMRISTRNWVDSGQIVIIRETL